MNYKYHVLWLDDEPIKVLGEIREAYPHIYIDKVDYVDVCEMILEKQPEKYHAIILDANGVHSDTPEKGANKRGFLRLVNTVIENRLPLYIYSGQLLRAVDGDTEDVILEELYRLGLREKENIFFKSGGPYELIEKIVKDLESMHQYYIGNEYMLDFFTRGWIGKKYKTEFLDPIMKYYYEKDYDSAHGNQMRNITEQILIKVQEKFKVTKTKEGDQNFFSDVATGIKINKLDFSQTIIGPLRHMIELANARSHQAMNEEERKLYFDSDYSTFFIVTNWFNKLMTRLEDSQNATYDKDEQKRPANSPVQEKLADNVVQPQTHPSDRTGVVVSPYEEDGRAYCDIKVEIPSKWKHCKKLLITGIRPNTNPKISAKWFPYCEEIE